MGGDDEFELGESTLRLLLRRSSDTDSSEASGSRSRRRKSSSKGREYRCVAENMLNAP